MYQNIISWKRRSILLLFIIFIFPLISSAESYLIKAKKIYTASHGIINDGQILIEDGKISQVGKNFPVSGDIKVIKANVVLPGLIDIHTHLGVYSLPMVEENSDGNEMTNPCTPQVRALDSFNFDDPAIKIGLSGGVTTIVSRPGSGNVIGGTSVAVKLKNAPPEQMIFKEICDLKMAIEGNPVGVYKSKNRMPSTLMAVYHLAEKSFLLAQEYQKDWEKYEKEKKKGEKVTPPKRDLGKETLVMALKREIPVHIHCATASEIMSCIRLADKFNLKLSLGHAYWAYLIVDELAKRKDVHFNIGPPMFFNYFENPLSFKNNPAILANAGLKVSLQTDALGGGQKNLLHLAKLCVRYGMKEEDALKAITIREAEAVGLDDRIGSIDPGKDADLVFLDGKPFEFTTSVERVMIDGKIEYENSRRDKVSFDTATLPLKKSLVIPEDLKNHKKIALQGGTIYTMTGPPLKDGTILIDKSKIVKVGKNISIPRNYTVIDAKEFVIMPGLISPRSYTGISSNWRRQNSINETSKSVVPEMEVKHAIEPQAPQFTFARELGVTTAMVTPGNRNVMGGRGVILKTIGKVVDKMIVKDQAVMVFGLGPSAKRKSSMPTTRMGIAATLRETLIKAREYKEKLLKYSKGKDKGKKPKRDLAMEALLPVLKQEIPVLVHCERKDDILTALRIADEFKLKIILDGATDAHKLVEQIKSRGVPVILTNLFRGLGNIEDKGFNPQNPLLLNRAGIRIAFRYSEGSWVVPGAGNPGGDLLEIAALTVKNGLSAEAALKAITIDAAKIIGMEKQIGSLESGKDADILVLRGHPLATLSVPEAVFINGKLVYNRKAGKRISY